MLKIKPIDTNEVRDLKQQRDELLEALVADIISTDDFIESMPNIPFREESIAKHISRIELIEKIYGMKWGDIRRRMK